MYSITVGFSSTVYGWPKPLSLYGSIGFLPDILQLTQASIIALAPLSYSTKQAIITFRSTLNSPAPGKGTASDHKRPSVEPNPPRQNPHRCSIVNVVVVRIDVRHRGKKLTK